MLTVKRFSDFDACKKQWIELENSVPHYPFQSFWYNELFAETFCKKDNIHLLGIYENEKLLALGSFEKIDNTVLLLGMKQVLGGQDITDYGDMLFVHDLS